MKNFLFVFFTSLFLASSVAAEDYPSIQEIRDFLDGDESLWPKFEACSNNHNDCAFAAGHLLVKNKDFEQAEQFFLKALEKNDIQAARAIIWLNTERNRSIETFAWSQLELTYQMQKQNVELSELNDTWAFMHLFRNNEILRKEEIEEGAILAADLMNRWLPGLLADQSDSESTVANETSDLCIRYPTRRVAPVYPTGLARDFEMGWTYHVVEINEKGNVIDQVSILYTNNEFRRVSRKALQRWKFEPLTEDSNCTNRRFTQTFEFSLSN